MMQLKEYLTNQPKIFTCSEEYLTDQPQILLQSIP